MGITSIGVDLGSVIGGAFGLLGGMQRNSAQAEASQQQMDFQERMSNTAYQRAVSDMRAAGLNPAMAYQQGGAGTPVGSMPQYENVATGAMQAAMNNAQVANIHADTENKQAARDLMEAQAMAQRASAWKVQSETGLIDKQIQDITNKLEMNWWMADADVKRAAMDKLVQDVQHSIASQTNIEQQTEQIKQSMKLLVEQTGTEGARRILEEMKAKAMQSIQSDAANPYMVDKWLDWIDKSIATLTDSVGFLGKGIKKVFKPDLRKAKAMEP